MPYGNNILTSIYGRRLGLQAFAPAQSGAAIASEFLVGPDDIRLGLTTNESTATSMAPAGISVLVGTSAASTPVYTLAPPIPGVRKVVVFGSTDSAIYAKAPTGSAIQGTSLGATACAAIRSSGGGAIELMGITTASFATLNVSSTAVNTVAFQATT